jgi:hypothetical protein
MTPPPSVPGVDQPVPQTLIARSPGIVEPRPRGCDDVWVAIRRPAADPNANPPTVALSPAVHFAGEQNQRGLGRLDNTADLRPGQHRRASDSGAWDLLTGVPPGEGAIPSPAGLYRVCSGRQPRASGGVSVGAARCHVGIDRRSPSTPAARSGLEPGDGVDQPVHQPVPHSYIVRSPRPALRLPASFLRPFPAGASLVKPTLPALATSRRQC